MLRRALGLEPAGDEEETSIDLAGPLRDLVLEVAHTRPSPAALLSASSRMAMGGLFSVQQSGSFRMIGPHPAAMVALLAFWVLFWAAGCRVLYRRLRAPR